LRYAQSNTIWEGTENIICSILALMITLAISVNSILPECLLRVHFCEVRPACTLRTENQTVASTMTSWHLGAPVCAFFYSLLPEAPSRVNTIYMTSFLLAVRLAPPLCLWMGQYQWNGVRIVGIAMLFVPYR